MISTLYFLPPTSSPPLALTPSAANCAAYCIPCPQAAPGPDKASTAPIFRVSWAWAAPVTASKPASTQYFFHKIGRASCRVHVYQSVLHLVVAVRLQKQYYNYIITALLIYNF